MSEILDLFLSRLSVPPQFLHEPGPDAEQLKTLLAIASRVPDHGKLIPWRFIVLQGEARHRLGRTLRELYAGDNPHAEETVLAYEQNRLARAPLVIAVVSRPAPHPKIPEWEQILSAGAVCMNLSMAVNAMSFGCCWLTHWYAYDRRFLDAMGLEAHEKIAGFLHIGTPDHRPADRIRPDLGQIVTYMA